MWRAAYDEAGIRDDSIPPRGLDALVADADCVVVSDMARAIETARRLTSRELFVTPLVREMPPPIPDWMHLRMPRQLWEWITYVRWAYWIARGIQAPRGAMDRATEAARWLDGLSEQHPHIAVVTHGTFRRLLTFELERIGWRKTPGSGRSYRHWSVWSLDK